MAKLTIRQLSDNFQKFDPIERADVIIKKNSKFGINLIQEQMIKGKMPNGRIIGIYASIPYSEMKFNLHSREAGLGFMDFALSGDYYKGMRISGKYPNNFVESLDRKAGKLMEIAEGDPLGFSKESAKLFRNKNDTDFNTEVKKLFK